MEFRKYRLENGGYTLAEVTKEKPTETDGFQIEIYNPKTGTTTVVFSLVEEDGVQTQTVIGGIEAWNELVVIEEVPEEETPARKKFLGIF